MVQLLYLYRRRESAVRQKIASGSLAALLNEVRLIEVSAIIGHARISFSRLFLYLNVIVHSQQIRKQEEDWKLSHKVNAGLSLPTCL